MKWDENAEELIRKVPFFVRKKVRARVEKEALANGGAVVSVADVNATRDGFLKKMDSDIRGYRIETCFSNGSCPNAAVKSESLVAKLNQLFEDADLLGFLRKQVEGDLKYHHEFKLTIADCPNACSQPQIKDVGIIGASRPGLSDIPCSSCGECVNSCREGAIILTDPSRPEIDLNACLYCKACINACPTGTIKEDEKGYRVLVGGKLGRHPRLARQIQGIKTQEQVMRIVQSCLDIYKARSVGGQRFSAIITDDDFEALNVFCR